MRRSRKNSKIGKRGIGEAEVGAGTRVGGRGPGGGRDGEGGDRDAWWRQNRRSGTRETSAGGNEVEGENKVVKFWKNG